MAFISSRLEHFASNVCQRVTIKKENKIGGCISGQMCSLVNRVIEHPLCVRCWVSSGSQVRYGPSVINAVRQMINS